jgi:hypothetical protein
MRSMTSVVWLALCGAVVGMTACYHVALPGGGDDTDPGTNDLDTDADSDADGDTDVDTDTDSDTDADDGLISWWPADGDALDHIGTNDGMATGSVTYTEGVMGEAFLFDGDSLIQTPIDGFPVGDTDRTLALWARVDALSWGEAFFAGYGFYDPYAQGNRTYALGASLSDEGQPLLFFWSPWGTWLNSAPIEIEFGTWHHVAATYQLGTCILYLDGSQVAEGPFDIDTAAEPFFIGRLPDPVGGDYGGIERRLIGALDDIRLYGRALAPEEIQLLAE